MQKRKKLCDTNNKDEYQELLLVFDLEKLFELNERKKERCKKQEKLKQIQNKTDFIWKNYVVFKEILRKPKKFQSKIFISF